MGRWPAGEAVAPPGSGVFPGGVRCTRRVAKNVRTPTKPTTRPATTIHSDAASSAGRAWFHALVESQSKVGSAGAGATIGLLGKYRRPASGARGTAAQAPPA